MTILPVLCCQCNIKAPSAQGSVVIGAAAALALFSFPAAAEPIQLPETEVVEVSPVEAEPEAVPEVAAAEELIAEPEPAATVEAETEPAAESPVTEENPAEGEPAEG